jgi:peptide/nickel transport system permease protein
MSRFILRRILQLGPLLLGITLISFGVMQLAPGDYLDTLRGQPTIRPETIERLRVQYGLVENPNFGDYLGMYWRWLWNALQGNFGYSFTYKIDVWTLILQRVYYTFILSFWATVLAWVIAIPLAFTSPRIAVGSPTVSRISSRLRAFRSPDSSWLCWP